MSSGSTILGKLWEIVSKVKGKEAGQLSVSSEG